MLVLFDAFEIGMLFAILSFGVFITFRILNIPDLTIDGSFTTGCAISAVFVTMQAPFLGIFMAVLAGALCGLVCGLLQTKGKIQPLLAGILTMTALYSVNLKIMSNQPNIALFQMETIFTKVREVLTFDATPYILVLILLFLMMILYAFFNTQLGLSLRATGDNEAMVKASSINAEHMKMLGIALANAIVAFAGALFAQYQHFADISGGVGMMVVGLASVIVGEALCHCHSLLGQLAGVVIGAIVYRLILTLALQFGIAASDLNIVSATLVAIAISLPQLKKRMLKEGK